MQKNIIVSITSLLQFYIFLSCIKKNIKNHNNYIIFANNIFLNVDTLKLIEKLCNQHKFKFLNLTEILKKNKNIISVKTINYYLKFLNVNIGNIEINEIYLRYKLNYPERLLINCFPNAKLNFFEDGMADYLSLKLLSGFMKNAVIKTYIKETLLKIIYSFSNNLIIKNFYNNKQLKYRIKKIYEILDYDKGDLKKRILLFSNKKSDISNEFKQTLIKFSPEYDNYFKKDTFLIIGNPFLLEKNNKDLKDIINSFYKKILNKIHLEFGNIQIAYKPHPNTPKFILDIIKSSFSKQIIITPKDILSEFLIANKKVVYVASYMSSSLLYANIINNNAKPIYFTINKIKIRGLYEQRKSIDFLFKELGFDKLVID